MTHFLSTKIIRKLIITISGYYIPNIFCHIYTYLKDLHMLLHINISPNHNKYVNGYVIFFFFSFIMILMMLCVTINLFNKLYVNDRYDHYLSL